jgi:hypothetical protein
MSVEQPAGQVTAVVTVRRDVENLRIANGRQVLLDRCGSSAPWFIAVHDDDDPAAGEQECPRGIPSVEAGHCNGG